MSGIVSVVCCQGNHLQGDKGHWGVFAHVCVPVHDHVNVSQNSLRYTSSEHISLSLTRTQTHMVLRPNAKLNHRDILQSVQDLCLTRTAAVSLNEA